jgi:Dimerisation and cyclophilin-binding domain of Mon2
MAGTPWSMMTKTFSRIRNECPRKLKDLRASCDEIISLLLDKDKDADDENADPYFHYFQQACECKHTKIVEIALDGIHSLIGALHLLINSLLLIRVPNPCPYTCSFRTWLPSR